MGLEMKGLKDAIKDLNEKANALSDGCLAGLIQGALLIRGEAQKNTPVVTGNLRNSAYVQTAKGTTGEGKFKGKTAGTERTRFVSAVMKSASEIAGSKTPLVIVGFTASYAAFVHENPRAGKTGGVSPSGKSYVPKNKKWRGKRVSQRIRFSSVGGYKFLERAIKDNSARVVKLIIDSAKKKAMGI